MKRRLLFLALFTFELATNSSKNFLLEEPPAVTELFLRSHQTLLTT